jgi:hypothetical protein
VNHARDRLRVRTCDEGQNGDGESEVVQCL